MFNDEELQYMHPRMTIAYIVEKTHLTYGTFDTIPKNAVGARITTLFPVVSAKGTITLSSDTYNLLVGEVFAIEKILENKQEELQKYEKAGVKQVVVTPLGITPLKPEDAVFQTHEEMSKAIQKIYETFQSIQFSVQNSETQIIHR